MSAGGVMHLSCASAGRCTAEPKCPAETCARAARRVDTTPTRPAAAAEIEDLAARFDESAAWLLDGKPYPQGRAVGAGHFRRVAEVLRAIGGTASAAPPVTQADHGAAQAVRSLLWDEHPECCGRPAVGAEHGGMQEQVCCGNPEPALLNDAQIVASLRELFPDAPAAVTATTALPDLTPEQLDNVTRWPLRQYGPGEDGLLAAAVAQATWAMARANTKLLATPASAPPAEPPLPLLVRDAARELTISCVDACAALREAGLGNFSQGSAVTAPMMRVLRERFDNSLEPAEPVFYWRPLKDGLYEGPHHARSVHGRLMREAKPGEWHPLYAGRPPREAEPVAREAGEPAGAAEFTDAEHVAYIQRYGGNCRDCADNDGVCPNSGMPCAESGKAIRHVLDALAYGVKHGFISNPLAAVTAPPAPPAYPPCAECGKQHQGEGWAMYCAACVAAVAAGHPEVVAIAAIVRKMRSDLERVGGFDNEMLGVPAGGVRSYIKKLEAALAGQGKPEALELSDERIDFIADTLVKGMPDGIRGFCTTWGWRQFARALLADCAGHYAAAAPREGVTS